MKKINLAVGAAFTWYGSEKLISENPNYFGWILIAIGIITILSAFFSFTGRGSRWGGGSGWGDGGGSGWGDPGGGDCGGGGD